MFIIQYNILLSRCKGFSQTIFMEYVWMMSVLSDL